MDSIHLGVSILQPLTVASVRLPFYTLWTPKGIRFSNEIPQSFIIPEKIVADYLSLVDSEILPWGVKHR